MAATDPFETNYLAAWRRHHRRLLRSLPESWIRQEPARTGDCPEHEKPLLEERLRAMAEEAIVASGETLAKLSNSDFRLARFLEPIDFRIPAGLRRGRAAELLADDYDRVKDARSYGGQAVGADENNAISRLIYLLTWADELAPDGYTDPRL